MYAQTYRKAEKYVMIKLIQAFIKTLLSAYLIHLQNNLSSLIWHNMWFPYLSVCLFVPVVFSKDMQISHIWDVPT